MKFREKLALIFLASYCIAGCALFAKSGVTAKDANEITSTGATIEGCENQAREAGTIDVYDSCMKEAGLH